MRSHIYWYIRLLLWVTFFSGYVCLATRWISLRIQDQAFGQYIGHVVQLAATEHRPAKEVRALLLVKAEDLSLPLQEDSIRVTAGAENLRAVVRYERDLRIPILEHPIYRIGFEHDLTHKR